MIQPSRINMTHHSKHKGFTLIELLMVIAIIGLLSSITLASLQTARARSRDSRRIQDLQQARTALTLYRDSVGNWMETGSGCGSGGTGNGWFNYNYSGAPIPMSQCLVNGRFSPDEIMDPTGARNGSSPGNSVYTYMKYTCTLGTYLYAKLETRPQLSSATDNTCCANCDTSYGMNYVLKVR